VVSIPATLESLSQSPVLPGDPELDLSKQYTTVFERREVRFYLALCNTTKAASTYWFQLSPGLLFCETGPLLPPELAE
jgi:hypothetical protein